MTLNKASMDLLKQLSAVWTDYQEYMKQEFDHNPRPIEDEILLQIALEDEISKMQALMESNRRGE